MKHMKSLVECLLESMSVDIDNLSKKEKEALENLNTYLKFIEDKLTNNVDKDWLKYGRKPFVIHSNEMRGPIFTFRRKAKDLEQPIVDEPIWKEVCDYTPKGFVSKTYLSPDYYEKLLANTGIMFVWNVFGSYGPEGGHDREFVEIHLDIKFRPSSYKFLHQYVCDKLTEMLVK